MRTHIYYNDKRFEIHENESVLTCLLRNKLNVPHSCQSGVCQSCMMQAIEGNLAEKSQIGLKETFRQQNLFLACQCFPNSDLKIQLPNENNLSVKAQIIEKKHLNHTIIQLRLRPEKKFECIPGQYCTFINPMQIARSYSIANNPLKEPYIELHIRLIPNGKMSTWLQKHAQIGDEITLQGPAGNCFYTPEENNNDSQIVLAGTGTGLAPLYGIVIDALAQGYQGPIQLYHGALNASNLYFIKELKKIALEHHNFSYNPCVLHSEENGFYQIGDIETIVMNNMPNEKKNIKLFLCGAPEFVNSLKTKAFLSGISSKNIYADAFLPSKS